MASPPWIYRLAIRILSPLLVFYTLFRAYKDGGKRYLHERFGFYANNKKSTGAPVESARRWIHAASVGEVLTVLPLIKAISDPLLVTTMSPTGAAVLDQQNLKHVQHAFLPLDFPGACHRFFKNSRVEQGWIVETEIWPWLYASARRHQVALTIINGRLSDKTSQQAHGLLAKTYYRALRGVRVLARSEADTQRFIQLGAEHVQTAGNLKYARSNSNHRDPIAALIDRPYILAASTHEDEEKQLAFAWLSTKEKLVAPVLFVIAPRHPDRAAQIIKELTTIGLTCSRRSCQEAVNTSTEIYIADTLGEMQAWYANAQACFVGGSLIERGGHNVLEPARLECPIVTGPHTFNFDDIIQPMLADEALLVADNANEVITRLSHMATARSDYQQMIDKARTHADYCESVLEKYLQLLSV